MELQGKNIVITGGTSGIGRCLVDKLANENQVIVISRNLEKLEALATEFPSLKYYQCNLADLEQLEEVCQSLLKDFPRIDILVNNAGIQYTPVFLSDDFNRHTIEEEITVNFTSICYITHALLPSLLADERRAIILNVNSALGFYPKTSSAVYCATKGAMNILTLSLSYQFEKTNVKVLQAVMPIVDTPMTAGRGSGKMSAEKAAEAIISGIKKEIPEHFIGKSKLLMLIGRISQTIARGILKGW